MRYPRSVSAVAACILVAALLACASGKVGPFPSVPATTTPADEGPPSDNPVGRPIFPVDPGPPLVMTAQQLGQELSEDYHSTMLRYSRNRLQITGVVTEPYLYPSGAQYKNFDTISGLTFTLQVTDKQTGAKRPYQLYCCFRYLMKSDDPDRALVNIGKTVTLRCQVPGTGGAKNTTLNNCVLVK